MEEIKYFRLEYNEKLGKFHYDSFSKRKEDIINWETIAMVIKQSELEQFLKYVSEIYPSMNDTSETIFPKAIQIKNLFNRFSGISEL